MPNKIVEDKMTKLVGLLGDMAEKGCVDELDSGPTTDFAKECWESFATYMTTRIFGIRIIRFHPVWKSMIRRSETRYQFT